MIIECTNEIARKITNLQYVKKLRAASYLLCLIGENGEYIAKSWHKKAPRVPFGNVLISFM